MIKRSWLIGQSPLALWGTRTSSLAANPLLTCRHGPSWRMRPGHRRSRVKRLCCIHRRSTSVSSRTVWRESLSSHRLLMWNGLLASQIVLSPPAV